MTFSSPKKGCVICGADACIHMSSPRAPVERYLKDQRLWLSEVLRMPEAWLKEVRFEAARSYHYRKVVVEFNFPNDLRLPSQYQDETPAIKENIDMPDQDLSKWARVKSVHTSDLDQATSDGWTVIGVSQLTGEYLVGLDKMDAERKVQAHIAELKEQLKSCQATASDRLRQLEKLWASYDEMYKQNQDLEAERDNAQYHMDRYNNSRHQMESDIAKIRNAIGQDKMDEILGTGQWPAN